MKDYFRFNEPIRTPNHPDKAYVVITKDGDEINLIRFGAQYEEREWVGLTHDEILDSLAPSYEYLEKEFFSIVRSLEAKLKEKNA